MRYFLLPLAALMSMVASAPAGTHLTWRPLFEPGSGGWLTGIAVDPADSGHVLLGGDMLGIGVSWTGGEEWDCAYGTLSYEIANFTFNPKHPGEVWAGTMSGPHVSMDGGIHWESRREGLPPVSDNSYRTPIQQVFVDPDKDGRLLAFGGSWRGWQSIGDTMFGWVWETLDDGKTWHEYSRVKRYRNIKWVAAAAGGLKVFYANVQGEGLYRSGDGAKTWTPVTGLPENRVNQVVTHPTDANVVWVTLDNIKPEGSPLFGPGGVWRSVDGGITWKDASKGLPQVSSGDGNMASRFAPLTVSPSNPKVLYTSDTVFDNPAIYRSDDGGETWRGVFTRQTHEGMGTAYPAGIGATVITVDPHDADVVYCAGSEAVIKSSDGGKTWKDMTAEKAPENAAKKVAPAATFWRGRGYSGLCSLMVRFDPADPNVTGIVAMDAGRLWISEDGEKTWRFADMGFSWAWGGGHDVAFGGKDGQTLLGAFGQQGSSGNVGLSTDAGYTWKMLGQPGSGLPPKNTGEASSAYMLPDVSRQMWVVYNGTLYRSADAGATWKGLIGNGCNHIFAAQGKGYPFYVAGSFGVVGTTDGTNFAPVANGPKPSYDGAVDPRNPNVIYVTQNYNHGGCVWKYDGKQWTKALDNPLVSGIAIDPTDGNRLIASTDRDPFRDVCDASGAWISEDAGKTWSNQRDGLACLRGWNVAINPHDPEKVYFCSLGRGFFVARWPKK